MPLIDPMDTFLAGQTLVPEQLADEVISRVGLVFDRFLEGAVCDPAVPGRVFDPREMNPTIETALAILRIDPDCPSVAERMIEINWRSVSP